MYLRSKAAYEALKDFQILALPSVDSLKAFTSAISKEPGPNHQLLKTAHEEYRAYNQAREQMGKKPALGLGCLIFDEVKVATGNLKAGGFCS